VLEAAAVNSHSRVIYVILHQRPGAVPGRGPLRTRQMTPMRGAATPSPSAARRGFVRAVDASARGDYRFLDRVRVPYFDFQAGGVRAGSPGVRAGTRVL